MGFFIFIPIIIFHIICIILFYYKYFNLIQGKIKDIVYGITNWKLVKKDNKAKKLKQKLEREKLREQKKEIMNININNINTIINEDLINKNELKFENKNVIKLKNPIPNLITNNNNSYFDNNYNYLNPPKKGTRKSHQNVINNYLNFVNDNKGGVINKSINNINSINELSAKESIIKNIREIMAYNDAELNQLSYKLALKYDNRAYFEYYFSLIKTKHILIFTFFYTSDYNSRIIKIDLFFINCIIYFALNTLFFDDDAMHKIYKDKGKFDFAYQLPKIIYSTIISSVLNTLLKLLALSEDYILDLKREKQ